MRIVASVQPIVFFACAIVLLLFIPNPCEAQHPKGSTLLFMEIKADHLFYSIDKKICAGRGGVTITCALSALAGQVWSLNLERDLSKLDGNVVLVGRDGSVLRGDRAIIDGRNLIVCLENEHDSPSWYDLKNGIKLSEKPPAFPNHEDDLFATVDSVRAANVSIETSLIRYYPDRQVRFWRGLLYFEGTAAGVIPYLAVSTGSRPPPPGFALENVGLRSDEGFSLGLGYRYLMSDNFFGALSLGGRHLLFAGDFNREPLGELALDVNVRGQAGSLDSTTSVLTNNEIRHYFHLMTNKNSTPTYSLDMQFLRRDVSEKPYLVDTHQRVSWPGGRSLSLDMNHDLDSEWSTALGYREILFRNVSGQCDFSYFRGATTSDGVRNDRSRVAAALDWVPRFFYTGLSFSREQYYIDDFTNEEAQLAIRVAPLSTPDRSLTLLVSNGFTMKRLYRDRTAESLSNTSSAALKSAPLLLTDNTQFEVETGITHRWENNLRQELFLDYGAQVTHAMTDTVQAGFRYTFLSRCDAATPWLSQGYSSQIGSLFYRLLLPQNTEGGMALDYDVAAGQPLAGISRFRVFLGAFLSAEVQAEYSFYSEDWSRADFILVRDLHFSEIRVIYRAVSESFLIEYSARF